MSRWSYIKKTYSMSRSLARLRGGFAPRYFVDALCCSVKHGASPENYMALRFYALSERERETFLTSGRSKALDARLNARATARDLRVLARKELFDDEFKDFIRREHLYAPACSAGDFSAFLARHQELIIKPASGLMGRGIERLDTRSPDASALYERCRSGELLLEEPIRQHPKLSRLNDTSVNSVRVNAARDHNGGVRLIGACLKCGGAGAVTDNFHSGGVAYPLDLQTGEVTGPGRNNSDVTDYFRHPSSGAYMPGFRVPFWRELIDYARRAMDVVPSVGYVGWDIAVTPSGPELIEGNCHWPGGNIIQFDGVGKYPLLLDCLGDTL